MKTLAFASLASLAILSAAACSSSSKPTVAAGDGGTAATCANPVALTQQLDSCTSCTFASTANPAACKDNRPMNACCAWVQEPQQEAQRGIGLHYFGSPDGSTAPDLGCLTTPVALGTSKTVKVTGHVKLFSSGNDSSGVKIEIFKEGANGALGDLVGAAYVTTNDDAKDPPLTPLPTWSSKCPTDGCRLRSFTYDGVPTETPLIVKTSDATGTGNTWSELYDYNIYIPNSAVDATGTATYDPSAVAATDVNTVASAAGGFTIKPDKGVLAGEVHDCGDVRLSGAMVNTDLAHEGEMFYFNDVESDPLPDKTRAPQGLGTSKLGLFGALNIDTGTPMRISAVVKSGGKDVLLGTYTVQLFPGAITALSFRGRRPWQK
jgi:hypothetical protein